MSSPRKAEVFPAFRVVSTSLCYQRLWMVYPEISEGYVGVSYTSLEFVHVDKRRPPPPTTETCEEIHNHINVKTHTLLTVELGVVSPAFRDCSYRSSWPLIILSLCTVSYSITTKCHRKL